jgi:hypothetical protein
MCMVCTRRAMSQKIHSHIFPCRKTSRPESSKMIRGGDHAGCCDILCQKYLCCYHMCTFSRKSLTQYAMFPPVHPNPTWSVANIIIRSYLTRTLLLYISSYFLNTTVQGTCLGFSPAQRMPQDWLIDCASENRH